MFCACFHNQILKTCLLLHLVPQKQQFRKFDPNQLKTILIRNAKLLIIRHIVVSCGTAIAALFLLAKKEER